MTLHIGGRCVDVANESLANGASVVSGTCTGHASQAWALTSNSDGSYTLRNVNSGDCLDIAYHAPGLGAPVVQGSCTGSSFQTWRLTAA